MDRKFAFLTAGLLTGVILVVVFALVEPIGRGAAMSASAADSVSSTDPSIAGTGDTEIAADYMRTLEAALQEREAALQTQVTAGKAALDEVDAQFQPQIQSLQDQTAGLDSAIEQQTASIDALQSQIAQTQSLIQQDEAQYQQAIVRMNDANGQLRQELDATLAELQTAYSQIAARQAAAASSASASQGNGSGYSEHKDDDRGEEREGDRDGGGEKHDDDRGGEHEGGDDD